MEEYGAIVLALAAIVIIGINELVSCHKHNKATKKRLDEIRKRKERELDELLR